MSAVAKSRRSRVKLVVLATGLIIAAQFWSVVRDTGRVRAVIYNEGPGTMEDVTLVCGNETTQLGTLNDESSRYASFRPAERTTVVTATWTGADGHHEAAWATERGQRLTVRVNADGPPTVSREFSLGRRLLDAFESE
jgi:hypothetical protein